MALSEKVVSTVCSMNKGYEGDNGKDVIYNITISNLKEGMTAEAMIEISDAVHELTIGKMYTTDRKQFKELVE